MILIHSQDLRNIMDGVTYLCGYQFSWLCLPANIACLCKWSNVTSSDESEMLHKMEIIRKLLLIITPETVIHPDTAQCLILQGELEGERNWLLYQIEEAEEVMYCLHIFHCKYWLGWEKKTGSVLRSCTKKRFLPPSNSPWLTPPFARWDDVLITHDGWWCVYLR